LAHIDVKGIKIFELEHEQPFHFTVPQGTCLMVSGPSGSGKSLLLRAIADLDPHQGDVLLDGQSRQTMAAPSWRRQVSLIPTETRWWFDLVGDHFHAEVNLLNPLGFDADVLGWEIRRLSTGEKQRLGLIRALALQPKALLLDEPTASLDAGFTAAFESIVKDRMVQGVAVIWVSHDPDQIDRMASATLKIERTNWTWQHDY